MTDEQLKVMAKTAFDVLNWARRMSMKQDEQLNEVVKGFRVDLNNFEKTGTHP